MHLLKKMLLGVVGALLVFFLVLTALDSGIIRVAGSSAPIKGILADSGIYNSLISSTLGQAETQTGTKGQIPLAQAAIVQAAEASITPQLVQANAEKFLDGVYHWLNGQVPEPDFVLDFRAAKATFADQIAKIARARAAALPRCKTTVVYTAKFDVFNAACLPAGVTPQQIAASAKDTVLHGKGFLNDPVITAQTLKQSGSNASIFADQFKSAPGIYQKIKATPIALALITILLILGVVLLSETRLKGVKHAGIILTAVGVLLMVFAVSATSAVHDILLPKINFSSSTIQPADVRKMVNDVVRRIDNTYIAIGAGYAVLGGLAIGGYYYALRKHPPAELEGEVSEKAESKPKKAPPKN